MFSFSAVVIALLLIPTFICLLILQLFFPKNTLKLHEAYFIPFGLGITLLVNLLCDTRIFRFIELLYPPVNDGEQLETQFVANLLQQKQELVIEYLWFLLVPVVVFAAIMGIMYYVWRTHIVYPYPKCNRVTRFLGQKVGSLLVNYMGKMTAYDPTQRMLFVDVLDASDSLYSGIFYDYFTEDKRLVGVQLSNVIRYSFKSEKERKDITDGQTSGTGSFPAPYLLPNNGIMFFPVEKIQNLHFWYLTKGHSESVHLARPRDQVRFAWLLGIRYSLPHLNLDIKGYLYDSEEDRERDVTYLAKAFNTLGIDVNELADTITFDKPKEDSESPRAN